MQELEIKFEPPDVLGIPPPSDEPIGVATGVFKPLSPQPSSLPLFSGHSDLSPSYHSLPLDNVSPQLLTPSQFLPTKNMNDLLQMPSDFETTPPKQSVTDQSSFTAITMEMTSSVDVPTEQISSSGSDVFKQRDDVDLLKLETEHAVSLCTNSIITLAVTLNF